MRCGVSAVVPKVIKTDIMTAMQDKLFATCAVAAFFIWSNEVYSQMTDAESDMLLHQNVKVKQLDVLSYRKLLKETYQDKDADVLLLTMVALDKGALFPDNASLTDVREIFGEKGVHAINVSTCLVELQKGKSKKNYVKPTDGFVKAESNEWYLIIQLNDKKQVHAAYMYLGLASRVSGFLDAQPRKQR